MDKIEIEHNLQKYYDNWETKKQIVTCFLLTHQRPHYVSLMIDSILKQTYSNFYLIVLDNMSGDNTQAIVESFGDDRIIYLERESNKDMEVTNLRFAFKVCKTKYLTVFHDDDIVLPEYFEYMIPFMINGGYSLGAPRFNIIDENGFVYIESKKLNKTIEYSEGTYLINSFTLGKSHGILFPCSIYDSKFFFDIEKYTSKEAGPSGDNYLCMQTERYGGVIGLCDEALYNYRVFKKQHSSNPKVVVTMHLQLLSFLFKQDYYKKIMYPYIYRYNIFVTKAITKGLGFYCKGDINRDVLKEIKNYIHKPLKNKNTIIYFVILFLFCYSPKFIAVFIYKLLRFIKKVVTRFK